MRRQATHSFLLLWSDLWGSPVDDRLLPKRKLGGGGRRRRRRRRSRSRSRRRSMRSMRSMRSRS